MTHITSFIFIIVLAGCSFIDDAQKKETSSRNNSKTADLMALKFHEVPDSFADCSELQSYVSSVLTQKSDLDKKAQDHYRKSRVDNVNIDTIGMPEPGFEDMANGEATNTMESAPAQDQGGDVLTNVQESDVDEADFSKISGMNIYVASGDYIQVTSRDDLSYIGKMKLPDLENIKLFVNNDHLVLLGTEQSRRTVCVKGEDNEKSCSYKEEHVTKVILYKESAGELPKEAQSAEVVGLYQHARLTNGKLVLMTQDQLDVRIHKAVPDSDQTQPKPGPDPILTDPPSSETIEVFSLTADEPKVKFRSGMNLRLHPIPAEPVVIDEDESKIWGVGCNNIVRPVIDDTDFTLTKITSIDLGSEDLTKHDAASLGGGSAFYMTSKAAYVAKQGISFNPWGYLMDDEALREKFESLAEKLAITKFHFAKDQGQVHVSSRGIIEGRVKDQWAFKEFADDNALIVATTDNGRGGEEQANNLFALKEEGETLRVTSSIKGFGETETIRSIRYVGRVAYVVTFRQTDPLFAFDLSNLDDLDLLGELHIPGFSAYLHPHGDDQLIGVGYDGTDAGRITSLQVSLFDVGDTTDPKRLDFKTIGNQSSQSEAINDHKAFYYDKEASMFAIPFRNARLEVLNAPTLFEVDPINGQPYFQQQYVNQNNGAAFYKIVDNKLEEYLRIYHGDLYDGRCHKITSPRSQYSYEVRRIFKIDGRVISVSEIGIKEHNLDDKAVVKQTKFSSTDEDC